MEQHRGVTEPPAQPEAGLAKAYGPCIGLPAYYRQPRATRHAVSRMEERHNLALTDDMARSVIASVEMQRTRRVRNADDLRLCLDEGCVFTHPLPGSQEQWAVRIGSEWVRFIIAGCVIITVLPVPEKKRTTPKGSIKKKWLLDAA